jgi:hypothetical protein
MTTLSTYVCNGCQKQRASDTNHWRRVYVVRTGDTKPAGILFMEWAPAMTSLSFIRETFGDADGHVCGDACATLIFSRWLSTGSIEEKKAEAEHGGS